ncbi:MAG: DUF465 domain-containing protein [Desulfoplanes sp.]|jgi:hypothetical protein|nr:DUF465 domain-containing protein [Desulfoplanes sp.]
MEQRDLELIAQYCDQDEELKALWEQHIAFEKYLEKMSSKPFLTPEENVELKSVKKQKLAGKTSILALIKKYKK